MCNYFTSFDLFRRLSEKKCSLLGTLRQSRQEIPTLAKQKIQFYDNKIYKTVNTCLSTLTNYQSSKNVFILSSMHRSVIVPILENNKKKQTQYFHIIKRKTLLILMIKCLGCTVQNLEVVGGQCMYFIIL